MTMEEFYGGSVYIAASSQTTLYRNKRVYYLNPSSANIDHLLPDATTLRDGWFCIIVNAHASNTVDINDNDDVAVTTVGGQKARWVICEDQSSAAGSWRFSGEFDIAS